MDILKLDNKRAAFRVSTTECFVLLGLCLSGLILRFWGIEFGLPHDSRPDEIPNLQVVFRMLGEAISQGNWSFHPHAFNYGGLYYGLLCVAMWILFSIGQLSGWWVDWQAFILAYQINPTPFHLLLRGFSAVPSVLLIPAVWGVGYLAYGKRIAWVAAILTCTNYLLIRNAHFGSPDSLMVLAITLSLGAIILWRQSPEWKQSPQDTAIQPVENSEPSPLKKRYINPMRWVSLIIGISTGIKYPALLMLFPFWVMLGLEQTDWPGDRIEWKPVFSKIGESALWTLMGFALSSPWFLLDLPAALNWLSYEGAFYRFQISGVAVGWEFYPKIALPGGLGILVLTFSMLGLTLGLLPTHRTLLSKNTWAAHTIIMLSLLAFILFLGPNTRVMTRYAMPLLPMLLLLASFGIVQLSERLANACKKPRWTIPLLSVTSSIALIQPLSLSIQWDGLLRQGDTRQAARDWILSHTVANTAIAIGPRLGQLRLPVNYGQLMLETGPNNLIPPKRIEMQDIDARSKLSNRYDIGMLHQLGIRYVVLYGGNFLFSTPPWEWEQFKQAGLQPVFRISPYRSNTERLVGRTVSAQYDPLDALFIPYTGFEDVQLTGPEIWIFDLAQEPLRPAPLKPAEQSLIKSSP